MTRMLWVLLTTVSLAFWACDEGGTSTVMATPDAQSDTNGGSTTLTAASITSPATGATVEGAVQVEIAVPEGATKVELLVDGVVVAQQDITDGATTVTLDWTPAADGEYELTVRVEDADGNTATSEASTVVQDSADPQITTTLGRLSVLKGTVDVPVEITEANVASVKLFDAEAKTELASATEAVEVLSWDTTASEDGVVWIYLQITDAAGKTAATDGLPVVVVNNGEEATVQYIPLAEVYIPPNYADPGVESHTRVMTDSKPNIRKVISWLTWDVSQDWLLEYSLGQGFCPHNGIQYVAHESDSGEILIELARTDLPAVITAKDPAFSQNPETFPVSDDPKRFGSFFGHIAMMEPADKVNQKLPIEVHYVFLY